MKKKKTFRIVAGIFIAACVFAALIFLPKFFSRVTPYEDEHTIGNSSGNLLNGGLFCEDAEEKRIYFSNMNDNGTLYSMDLELGDLQKVYDDNVSYINSAGKYLFYTRRNDKKGAVGNIFLSFSNVGLYRLHKKSKNLGQLYNGPTQTATLYGNNVYYQHYEEGSGLDLYRSAIDGKSDTLLTEDGATPCCIVNDRIYYAGYDADHYIHSMSLNGGEETIYRGNCTNVLYRNNMIYYMDMDQDYKLACVHADGTEPALLTDKRICAYNFSYDGNKIYYQVDNATDDNGLYELDLASGTSNLVISGDYNYIHTTSQYIFFASYDLKKMYYIGKNGAIKGFNPGKTED